MDMSPGGMTQLIVSLVFSSIIIYIILIRPNKHIKLKKKNYPIYKLTLDCYLQVTILNIYNINVNVAFQQARKKQPDKNLFLC